MGGKGRNKFTKARSVEACHPEEMKIRKRKIKLTPLSKTPWREWIDLRVERSKSVKNKSIFEQHHAAKRIQAWWRGEKVRWRVWGDEGLQEVHAAIVIQTSLRGFFARKLAAKMKDDLEKEAATLIQKNYFGLVARKRVQILRAARLLNAASRVQACARGFKARKYAAFLREERRNEKAKQIQSVVRGHKAKLLFKQMQQLHADRLAAVECIRECARILPSMFRSTMKNVSDREIRENMAFQERVLRQAMILFAVHGDVDFALAVFSRILRCEPAHALALEMKAVALLASGARSIFKKIKHSFFFVELALDLVSRSRASRRKQYVIPHEDDLAWHPLLDNVHEFLMLCTWAKRGGYDEFKAVAHFGIALQCLGETDFARSLKYLKRSHDLIVSNSRICGELLENHLAWVQHLIHEHESFWRMPRTLMVKGKGNLLAFEKGDGVILEKGKTVPIVAPFQQIANSLKRKEWNSKAELCVEAMSQCHVVKLPKAGICRLSLPGLEKERVAQLREQRRVFAAVDIQRVWRGLIARYEFRRRAKIKESIDNQKLHLVEKRLERLRLREQRRQAVVRLQARLRGYWVRQDLKEKHAATKQIQRIVRGRLGRLRFLEIERRIRMGAEVIVAYRGGKQLPLVRNGQSLHAIVSVHVLLTILRSGCNYLFVAEDLCTAEEYKGDFVEQQLDAFLERHNQSLPKTERVRKKHHEKVLPLLLPRLALTEPVKGLGDLASQQGSRTVVVL